MKLAPRTSSAFEIKYQSVAAWAILLLHFAGGAAWAQQDAHLHPTFPLLDKHGANVLDSGGAVSTMKTCGACHDAEYITSHSFHSDLGLQEMKEAGEIEDGRPWDFSPGFFGKWSPFTYRLLTPKKYEDFDLGTADWLRLFGARHVGGGPATTSRDGRPLTSLTIEDNDPETHVLNPETGQIEPWDWQKSGVVEMNCFLCHTPEPDNDARKAELQSGHFEWANTATLAGTGLVQKKGEIWQWNRSAFDGSGHVKSDYLKPQGPNNDNCGLCHGLVNTSGEIPLVTKGCKPEEWTTETTGEIFSPQKMRDSGLNLAGKQQLFRSFDVHSERLVECVDCHFSVNNPIYFQESEATRPAHLKFDARRLDFGDYLRRPSHQFAKGQSNQGALASNMNATMRRCESCHDPEPVHGWLPYKDRHLSALSCESCHIPKLFSPARQAYDWTVLTEDGGPRTECRGVKGDPVTIRSLVTGYEPVLMPRNELDGRTRLTPYNLITSWYWVYDDPPRPVRLEDLRAVYFEDGHYQPTILAALDADGDGRLAESELVLDTEEKIVIIKNRLAARGLENPKIAGDIQPFAIHHDVTNGEWATKKCVACHSDDSRINQAMVLAAKRPTGVEPKFVWTKNIVLSGKITTDDNGALVYRPDSSADGLFILGHDRIEWLHGAGFTFFVLTVLGIGMHGGLRIVWARRNGLPHHKVKRVYMYTTYERFWHWLQALAILGLIVTGLVIHSPVKFSFAGFEWAVNVHNILGFILLANAFLAAFYHVVGGQIKTYLPEPKGFFSQAIQQMTFYLYGIFKGEPHPFEKNPQKKLNPLQKITYLMILNVLLPLQIITGIVIWGAQRWPEILASLGGLPFLVPVHSLGAWLFAAFLVMHIYLTTTGHTVTSNIKAMVTGWEEVEVHENKSARDKQRRSELT